MTLPEKLGMRRVIQGDPIGGSEPSDDSSESGSVPSDSDAPKKPNKGKNRKIEDSEEESDFQGHHIFTAEPESDHVSDSDRMKRRKREKCRYHRATLVALKFQQTWLKDNPPAKYGREIQASVLKKFVQERRLWCKTGRLSTYISVNHRCRQVLNGKSL